MPSRRVVHCAPRTSSILALVSAFWLVYCLHEDQRQSISLLGQSAREVAGSIGPVPLEQRVRTRTERIGLGR
jgi:hypothetical protein